MPANLTPYKGLDVVDNATGAAGAALTDNFKDIADWHPKSNWTATTPPAGTNDEDEDYYPGSFWLDTTTRKLYVCTESGTTDSAKWQLVPYLLAVDSVGVNEPPKLSGDLDANSNKITNLAAPASTNDVARKADVDSRLPLSGGTMTGDINMNTSDITMNNGDIFKVKSLTFDGDAPGDLTIDYSSDGIASSIRIIGNLVGLGQAQISLANLTANRLFKLPNKAGTVMLDLVDDTTPQLGGDLDGQGNAISNVKGVAELLHLDLSQSSAPGTPAAVLKSFTVPADTLGTTNVIEIEANIYRSAGTTSDTIKIDFHFGGQRIGLTSLVNAATGGFVRARLWNNGATNAQIGYVRLDGTTQRVDRKTLTKDTTQNQDIELKILGGDANDTWTMEDFRVWLIRGL